MTLCPSPQSVHVQMLDEYEDFVVEVLCNRFVSHAVSWDDGAAPGPALAAGADDSDPAAATGGGGDAGAGAGAAAEAADAAALRPLLAVLLKVS